MPRAATFQHQREAHERALHEERLAWLAQPDPRWACGLPVTTSEVDLLTRCSRDHLALLDRVKAIGLRTTTPKEI